MSLTTALLLDSLLQPVLRQNVYLSLRTDRPAGGGAGTAEDPFDASTAAKFDAIMSSSVKAPANSTIVLGPGIFETTGYPAWSPRDGQRIVGRGTGVTTLKLVEVASSQFGVVVGMDTASASLAGFEMSDLAIDCNFAGNSGGTGATAAAVNIQGSRIFLRRVKAVNFGSQSAATDWGVIRAAGPGSVNCVLEECIVEPPDVGSPNKNAACFRFDGTSAAPHLNCVVRNCVARGVNDFQEPEAVPLGSSGLYLGCGAGTVAEGCQFAQLGLGIRGGAMGDLLVRMNYFRAVGGGLAFTASPSAAAGRIIAQDNFMEISSRTVWSEAPPAATKGILLAGGCDGDYSFKEVILRRNMVRDAADPVTVTDDLYGIDLSGCEQAVLENNILNNIGPALALPYASCGAVKFFNNQSNAGVLLRGYNGTNYVEELEDEAQDALLSF